MDWWSLASEKLRTLEEDVSKEIGIKPSSLIATADENRGNDEIVYNNTESWDGWTQEDDEWDDIQTTSQGNHGVVTEKDHQTDGNEMDSEGLSVEVNAEGFGVDVEKNGENNEGGSGLELSQKIEQMEFNSGKMEEEFGDREEQQQQQRQEEGDEDGYVDESVYREIEKEVVQMKLDLEAREKELERKEKEAVRLKSQRDSLRRQRDTKNAEADLVREKDRQIQLALKEGEKMSVKIAKLEAALREQKAEAKQVNETLVESEHELKETQSALDSLVSDCNRLESQLTSAVKERERAEMKLRDLGSESRSKAKLSSTLDEINEEIEATKRAQQMKSENQRMELQTVLDAKKEQLRAEITAEQSSSRRALEEVRKQIFEGNERWERLEASLNAEISDLESRCAQMEARNASLAATVPETTKPLIQQIDALHAAEQERRRAMEIVEANESKRLMQARENVSRAKEKLRVTERTLETSKSKVSVLEQQIQSVNEQRQEIQNDLMHLHQQASAEEAQNSKRNLELRATLDTLRNQVAQTESEWTTEHARLSEELEMLELSQKSVSEEVEVLRKSLEEKHVAAEMRQNRERSFNGGWDLMDVSSHGVFGKEEGIGTDLEQKCVEKLNNMLRQKSAILKELQSSLEQKENASKSLTNQVVELSARREKFLKEQEQNEENYYILLSRHTKLMELLSEKDRELIEIQQDLNDMKQMYKEQISELVSRLHVS